MKRGIILLLAVCLLCSGCSADLFAGLSNSSSYFYTFSAEGKEDLYLVKGTACQMSDDRNLTLVKLTAREDSTVTITGKQKPVRGSVQLIYTAPDGSETLIADTDDTSVDTVVSVKEGEGTIGFVSARALDDKEEKSIYKFDFRMKASEAVEFQGHGKEKKESVEMVEEPLEVLEIAEVEERLEELEIPEEKEFGDKMDHEDVFPGIEENWPESIVFKVDGLYAQPLMLDFDVEEPVVLSVSYTAESGKLRLKLVDESGKVYFEEPDIQEGEKAEYTVDIDEAGTYWIYVYAEYFEGEIVIKPEKEL